MRKNRQNLMNKRFGQLLVIAEAPPDVYEYKDGTRRSVSKWKCQCDCGNVVEVRSDALLQGRTKTCGCGRGRKQPQKLVKEVCQGCGKTFMRPAKARKVNIYCKDCIERGQREDARIIQNMNLGGAVRLAEAVIQRAREDYVNGEIGQRRKPDNMYALKMHDEATAFFRSRWFLTLAMIEDVNYDLLFKALDRAVDRRWNNGQIADDADDFVGDDWE